MKSTALQSVSIGPGLLMAAAPGIGSHGPALIAAVAASIAMLVGLWLRPAATLAVALTVAAVALGDPAPIPTALAGLGAVGYLVLRHAGVLTVPTAIAAVGFTFAGLVATAFPLRVPWLALLAPFAVFGLYAVATYPFLGVTRRQPR